MTNQQLDENKLIAQRRAKLAQLRSQGNAFPNDFRRCTMAGELHAKYEGKSQDQLEALSTRVRVAGRMMSRRIMGKASFAHLQDMSGRIQLFVQRDALQRSAREVAVNSWQTSVGRPETVTEVVAERLGVDYPVGRFNE